MSFKPYKELSVLSPETGDGFHKLVNSSGEVYAEVSSQEDAYRFIECWNACRKLAYPDSHIQETDAYVARLEARRKEAAALLAELQANFAELVSAHEEAKRAVAELVKWHGKRGGQADSLLAADKQDPEISRVMKLFDIEETSA